MRMAIFALPLIASAQTYTVDQAVATALERYAAVRVSSEKVTEAAQAIQLARTAYLPQADFLAQANRATRNNVFGMILPQSTLPGISGPPLAENSLTNVWGTAVGFLVSWEPFDFGLRAARVNAAAAKQRTAEAALTRTRFEIAVGAADGFLTVLAAEQTVRAAAAAVQRAQTLEKLVGAQVRAELRPGVDATRTKAEVALAESQQIQAEQAVAMAKASLSQFLQTPTFTAAPGALLDTPPAAILAQADLRTHPVAQERAAAVAEAQTQQKILDKSYYPKFNLQGTTYARGTGANPNFTTGGALSGLGPNIVNWGAGLTVTFPAMALPGLRIQRSLEASQTRAEQLRLEQVLQDLNAKLARATAQLDGARRLVTKIPAQLEAARAAELQATARYQAGLGTLVEVAEAQRLLAQTEIDDSLAKLAIWRAMLALSAAQGDIEPFLKAAVSGGR
ncbi:MAG: TolC family protein [Bryobacteraceae bacterium]|nr:TolC family protein [Bryobacteraceae bacterium]